MANEHTSACVACGAIRKVTIGPDAIRHLLATFETPGWKLLLSIWEMEATLALQALVKERDPEEILQRQADVRQLYRRLQMERQYQAAYEKDPRHATIMANLASIYRKQGKIHSLLYRMHIQLSIWNGREFKIKTHPASYLIK